MARRDQGDLAGALAAYRESLQVSRRLAEAISFHPPGPVGSATSASARTTWRHVLRDQGDLAGALAAYRESLQVRRRLAEADPSNAGWQARPQRQPEQRGECAPGPGGPRRSSGRVPGVAPGEAAARRGRSLQRRLAARPQRQPGQRGECALRDQGDLAGALAAYREPLQVSRRLAEAHPSNAGWQRDLSVSHNKVDDILRDKAIWWGTGRFPARPRGGPAARRGRSLQRRLAARPQRQPG